MHVLRNTALAPWPRLAKEPHHLLWHPEDRCLWVCNEKRVWRLGTDGAAAPVGSGFALPEKALRYSHPTSIFYWDTVRRTAVFALVGYGELTLLAVARDGTVEPLAHGGGPKPESEHVLVFDPKRGVLVWLTAGGKPGTARIYELGPEGTWRDVASLTRGQGRYDLGGWDARLNRVVLVDAHDRSTWAWDGADWRQLGQAPSDPWRRAFAGLTPEGHLLLAHAGRGAPPSLNELGADGHWIAHPGAPEVFGGIARDALGQTWIYAPWFGVGTVQHVLGRFEQGQIRPVGPVIPSIESGSLSGPARFFGPRLNVFSSPDPQPQHLFDATLGFEGMAPAAAAMVVDARGVHMLSGDGVLRSNETVHPAPPGFTPRVKSNLGSDGDGRLLAFGGEVTHGAKRLTDTWLFDGDWKALEVRGAPPPVEGALLAWHRDSDAWVSFGGRDKHFQSLEVTGVLAHGTWRVFPKKAATRYDVAAMGVDPVSGEVLLARFSTGMLRLSVWRGEGQWKELQTHELPHATRAFAWDSDARHWVAAGAGILIELPLGEVLDALDRTDFVAASPKKARAHSKPVSPPGRTAHHLVRTSDAAHVLGGPTRGVSTWPDCRECGGEMTHLVTFEAHPQRLPLRTHVGLAVFQCGGDACSTWEADAGANAALLLQTLEGGRGGPHVDAVSVDFVPHFEVDPESGENADDPAITQKLGGYPGWLQGEETPVCGTCREPMFFVAQLSEFVDAVNFGGGEGYVFCCPSEHAARFLWQS